MPKQSTGRPGFCLILRWLCAIGSCAVTVLVWAGGAAAGQSAALRTGLTQYHHTAWRVQDGAIASEIYTMTQTSDGYLWLTSDAGLVRFDGVRFKSIPVPDTAETNSIYAARDGALWVGYAHEAVRFFRGHLTRYTHPRAGRFGRFAEDAQGHLWATEQNSDTQKGLCRIDRDGPHCVGPADGFPCASGGDLLIQSGEVLVSAPEGLCRWRAGRGDLLLSGGQFNHGRRVALLRDGDGILLGFAHAGPGGGLERFANGKLAPYHVGAFDGTKLSVEALFRDRRGDLWIGTETDGVYRVHDGHADHMTQADGLSGNTVYGIFEDREGSIWIGTSGGLDRLRERPVIGFGTRQGLSADEIGSVAADRKGGLWIATPTGLDRLDVSQGSVRREGQLLKGKIVTAVAVDARDRIWAGYDSVLTMSDSRGVTRRIRRADGEDIGELNQLLPTPNGDVWVTSPLLTGNHLYRITGGRDVAEIPLAAGSGFPWIAASPEGELWVLDPAGRLTRYRGGMATIVEHPFPARRVLGMIGQAHGGLLVASSIGLFVRQDERWQAIDMSNGLPCNNVIDVLVDRRRDLWVRLACGIVRIRQQALHRWLGDTRRALPMLVLGGEDGALPGSASYYPQSAQSADGRIWYATDGPLLSVDPDDLKSNPAAPALRIENVVADGHSHDPGARVTLPALTHDLEIDFGPLSLARPERSQVRYRLEGFDRDWQSVGARRAAYYTDVPPGRYVFRVIAANESGVWNRNGASVMIEVRPAFYQTWWWYGLLLFIALLGVWQLLRMRLRYLAAQIETRLSAEQGERLRIARELHDTLLQSFHAVLVRFQLVANELTPTTPSRHKIEETLQLADRAMLEGRDRVLMLRSTLGQASLIEAFAAAVAQLQADSGIGLDLNVEGVPRTLATPVQDEFYRIGTEAIVNAIKHAEADRIAISIRFAPDALKLSVTDDGKGFDAGVFAEQKASRHFGIRGMQERANRVGAAFSLTSASGEGTIVEVELPAVRAYLPGARARLDGFWRFMRRRWLKQSRAS